ncbi:DUF167 domain-containing protein [Patescibacteria group bacterium]|nr:DUF167 domain-containing protein [Patescibacteria group bacterium]
MRILIRVRPNAKTTEIKGWEGTVLKIQVKAPPLEDRANRELLRFLAIEWRIPKTCLSLEKGAHGRNKLLNIADEYASRLPPKQE